MSLTAEELAKRDDFARAYRRGQEAMVREVERVVCGCAYGGTSWATRAEADRSARALGLAPGMALLEIGAGSGWPALYMAGQSGCDATLVDLPFDGLRIACDRARQDGLSGTVRAVVADAAALPFAAASFDAVNHSDVLCCLLRKREVLAECRRVIRPGGRMVFSVIYVPPGLAPADHARAAAAAPEFVATDQTYPRLLTATGWEILEQADLSAELRDSSLAKIRAETAIRDDLDALEGKQAVDGRHTLLRRRIEALDRGHLRRELFVAAPA